MNKQWNSVISDNMSLIWHHWNVFKDGVPTFLFVDISQQLSLSCLTSVPVTSGSFIIKLPDFYSLSSLPEVVIGPIKIFSMKNVLFRRWWVLSMYHSLTDIMISWVDRELMRKSLDFELLIINMLINVRQSTNIIWQLSHLNFLSKLWVFTKGKLCKGTNEKVKGTRDQVSVRDLQWFACSLGPVNKVSIFNSSPPSAAYMR